jgi:Uncharacterized conserved protein
MSKFYLKQKVFSIGEKFTVKDELERDVYTVTGSFFSFVKNFAIFNAGGAEIAKITKKVFSFLPTFFVEIYGKQTFTIKKEFTFFTPKYQIDGLGLNVEGNFWAMDFVVKKGAETVAVINKKWFTWGDSYEVDVLYPEFETTIITLVIAIDYVKMQQNSSSANSN